MLPPQSTTMTTIAPQSTYHQQATTTHQQQHQLDAMVVKGISSTNEGIPGTSDASREEEELWKKWEIDVSIACHGIKMPKSMKSLPPTDSLVLFVLFVYPSNQFKLERWTNLGCSVLAAKYGVLSAVALQVSIIQSYRILNTNTNTDWNIIGQLTINQRLGNDDDYHATTIIIIIPLMRQ